MGDLGSIPGSGRFPGRRERLPSPVFWPGEFHGLHRVSKSQTGLSNFHFSLIVIQGFPGSSVGKESACNAGDPGLIPGLGRSAGEGIGYSL